MIANRQDRIVWLLAAAVCLLTVFLFIINRLCPIMGEDVALAAILPHDEVASLSEFFSKMFSRVISQATNWNARIGELASIVFSCFPKIIFDAVNTAATVGTGLKTFFSGSPLSHFPSYSSPSISQCRLPNKPLESKSLKVGLWGNSTKHWPFTYGVLYIRGQSPIQ